MNKNTIHLNLAYRFYSKIKTKKIKKKSQKSYLVKNCEIFKWFNERPVKKSQQIWNSNDEINVCIELYVRFVGMVVANDKSLFRCLIT